MRFSELVKAAMQYLQESGRLTYRALQREFDLDTEILADLKAELIDARRVARDEDDKVLVWLGDSAAPAMSPPAATPRAPLPVGEPAPRPVPAPANLPTAEANEERKTITVLFVDIKGSTALLDGLDPEDARAVMDPALQLMIDAVHAYGGHVAQALGDGIFALFGAPVAHEDHAQRAVHAALAMQASLRAFSDRLRDTHGFPLESRIGVNTGDVVVRAIRKDETHTDYVPVGHAVNIASRVEQLASPGAIVVTESTQALVSGYFDLHPLGSTALKGVEVPVVLFMVLGPRAHATRMQLAAQRGLSEFVGRDAQLRQMIVAFERVREGQGQVIALAGEPGLGKSRLLHEFKHALPPGTPVQEIHAVAYAQGLAYFPIVETLRTRFSINPREDAERRAARVRRAVIALDRTLEDSVPYLLALLDGENVSSELLQMDAQVRRRRTHDALRRLFLAECRQQPVVLVCEDLHWIDAETQGVLDALVEHLGASRLLLIVAYRPEYRHDWSGKSYFDLVRLAPLRREDGARLLKNLLGDDPGLEAVKRQVLDLTEGTPFFIEEVVQALVEQGALGGQRGAHHALLAAALPKIPPTVQGVLAARIDRLPPAEKSLLLELSVIGREAPVNVLRSVGHRAAHEMELGLAALQKREFVYPKTAGEEIAYVFKHALTQEVAYQSQLLSHRRELHGQVGAAIEALHPLDLDTHVPMLAHHYNHSTNDRKAIEYLHRAGVQAIRRCASREALTSLDAALERIVRLPASPERDAEEIALQIARGTPLLALEGLSSPSADMLYSRVYEVANQRGHEDIARIALLGRGMVVAKSGRMVDAGKILDQAVALGARRPCARNTLSVGSQRGAVRFFAGRLREARQDLTSAVSVYRYDEHALLDDYWADYGVLAHGMLSKTAWWMGDFAVSEGQAEIALALADRLGHPQSQAFALYANMVLRTARREFDALAPLVERELALCERHGVPLFLAWGAFFEGHVRVAAGDVERGIAGIQRAQAQFRAINSRLLRPYCCAQLAQIHCELDQLDKAHATIEEGIAYAHETDERVHLAELLRLRGDVALGGSGKSGDVEAAHRSYQAAIEEARIREAAWLELRALISLTKLNGVSGVAPDAPVQLHALVRRVDDGSAVPELREAATLLNVNGIHGLGRT